MAITLRRSGSKKARALRAAKTTRRKAVKAKAVAGTTKAARKVAGTAAKGGMVAFALAKARKPLLALGAVGAGAAVALKLRSSGSSGDPGAAAPTAAPASDPMPTTAKPALAGATANGTEPVETTPPSAF